MFTEEETDELAKSFTESLKPVLEFRDTLGAILEGIEREKKRVIDRFSDNALLDLENGRVVDPD